MSKTAMQELIELLESEKKPAKTFLKNGCKKAIESIKEFAIKERNQIEQAYNQGDADRDNQQDGNSRQFKNCIDYYSKTYPQDEE